MKRITALILMSALFSFTQTAIADNSDTSSTQIRKRANIPFNFETGSLKMRRGELELRVLSDTDSSLSEKAGKNLRLKFILPQGFINGLINKDPGSIQKSGEHFTQESSGMLINLGADITTSIPENGLEGPKHYVVDANGAAAWSYQIVLYKSNPYEMAKKASESANKELLTYRDQFYRMCYHSEFVFHSSYTDYSELSEELKKKVTADEYAAVKSDCAYDSSLEQESFSQTIAQNDLKNLTNFMSRNDQKMQAAIKRAQTAYQNLEKYKNGEVAESNYTPFLTFDVRFGQVGALFSKPLTEDIRKTVGTVSAVELSFETSTLFNDVVNLAFFAEAHPLRIQAGSLKYVDSTKYIVGRSEGFTGARIGLFGFSLQDKFGISYDWKNANSVSNDLSLGSSGRGGRIGWKVEREKYNGATPITTHMFYGEVIAF